MIQIIGLDKWGQNVLKQIKHKFNESNFDCAFVRYDNAKYRLYRFKKCIKNEIYRSNVSSKDCIMFSASVAHSHFDQYFIIANTLDKVAQDISAPLVKFLNKRHKSVHTILVEPFNDGIDLKSKICIESLKIISANITVIKMQDYTSFYRINPGKTLGLINDTIVANINSFAEFKKCISIDDYDLYFSFKTYSIPGSLP